MPSENRAYDRLKRRFPGAFSQRFEDCFTTGRFDSCFTLQGCNAWVENKQVDRPKTSRGLIKPKVRPAQVAWESAMRQAGGVTRVALMVGTDLYILNGYRIADLKNGVTQEQLENWKLDMAAIFPDLIGKNP